MQLAEIQQRRQQIERWSELTPTRWIEAASPQRVGVNAFHPQLHDPGSGQAESIRARAVLLLIKSAVRR
jgi:hypothetical protein